MSPQPERHIILKMSAGHWTAAYSDDPDTTFSASTLNGAVDALTRARGGFQESSPESLKLTPPPDLESDPNGD